MAVSSPPSSSSRYSRSAPTAGAASSRREVDLHPLLVLGTAAAAKELAVRQLLDAAVEGDIPRAKKWAGRLKDFGEGVEVAAAAIADPKNKRDGCLHLAAAIGDSEMCKALITGYQVDVNSTDTNGATPIMFAIKGMQSIPVMRLLFDCGADLNKPDKGRITPLHVAVIQDATEAAEFLLSKGVFVDPLSEKGETPLHIAARSGNMMVLKLLLAHHANFEKPACSVYTPLSVAVFGSSLECLKLLIEAGADVNAGKPVTPLVVASAKGLTDCIKCLLEAGADANIPDESGKIPIEIAAFGGCSDCVATLFPATTPLATYAKWSIYDISQRGKSERMHKGSQLRAHGDSAFQGRDYDPTSHTHKLVEASMGDLSKEKHEKLVEHCHSLISSLSTMMLPVMIAMFAVDTPLSDAQKALFLGSFSCLGTVALIALSTSTSLLGRRWARFTLFITLSLLLLSLVVYHLALELAFPKFEGRKIMSLDIHVTYSLGNKVLFLLAAIAVISIWSALSRACLLCN